MSPISEDTASREALLKKPQEAGNNGRMWKRVIPEDPEIAQLKKRPNRDRLEDTLLKMVENVVDKKLRVLAPLVHDPAVVRGSPAPSLHDTEIVHGSSKAHSHTIRGTSTASVEESAQQLPTPLDEITISVVGSTPSLEYY